MRERILELDSSINEVIRKLYIAYKAATNFVDIIPYKTELKFILNMDYDEIEDPRKLGRDIIDKGKWGNVEVEFLLSAMVDIEYVLVSIRQSLENHEVEM